MIIGVLLTHTQTHMMSATATASTSRLIFQSTHIMLHFTRMGFVFISGLVLTLNYYNHTHNWLLFWRKRLIRIGIPYLFWNTFYLGINFIISGKQGFASSWWNTIVRANKYYMYYLILAALIYLFFPLFNYLFKRLENFQLLIVVFSLILQLIITATIIYVLPNARSGSVLSLLFRHYGENPLTYQAYFVLGAYFAVHWQSSLVWINKFGKLFVYLALLTSFATIPLYFFNKNVLQMANHRAQSIHQPFVAVMDVFVMIALFYIGHTFINAHPEWINPVHMFGKLTFGIYLTQTIWLDLLVGILKLISMPSWLVLILTPIGFIFVFSGAFWTSRLLSSFSIIRPLVGMHIHESERITSY